MSEDPEPAPAYVILMKTAEIIQTLASSNPRLRSRYDRFDILIAFRPCSDYYFDPNDVENECQDVEFIDEACDIESSEIDINCQYMLASAIFSGGGRNSPAAALWDWRESSRLPIPSCHHANDHSSILNRLYSICVKRAIPSGGKAMSKQANKTLPRPFQNEVQHAACSDSQQARHHQEGMTYSHRAASVEKTCTGSNRMRRWYRPPVVDYHRGLWERLLGCFGASRREA